MTAANRVISLTRSAPFAAVQADGLGCIAQPHQRIAERGVGELVAEGQPDQRVADPERDDRREEHIDQQPIQNNAFGNSETEETSAGLPDPTGSG